MVSLLGANHVLNGHLNLSCGWLGLNLRTPKRHVFDRDWTTSSQFVTILGSIVNIMISGVEGHLFDHLIGKRIFNLIMNKRCVQSPNLMREIATGSIWIC